MGIYIEEPLIIYINKKKIMKELEISSTKKTCGSTGGTVFGHQCKFEYKCFYTIW